ncbi:MAG: hypothetical protein CL609_17235 [Anaerolineaceae bacterium]|nr:hypothetical protein [Anaerolineaceae bacterium]
MNEISHKKAHRWIQKSSDGMLTDREEVLLANHLSGCDGCRSYQKELEDLQTSIKVSLQRRTVMLTRRFPQKKGEKQPAQLYQTLRRTIRMKKIQKVAYAFVGVFLMAVLLFVGISLGQQIIPTPGMSETSMPTKNVLSTQQPLVEEEVTIESLDVVLIDFYFYSSLTREQEAVNALVSQFNQIHKDEIVIQQTKDFPDLAGEGGYYQGMAEQFDCFVTQTDPRGAALSGAVLDLNAWMEAEKSAFQQDFDQTILDASRYEGSLINLPLSIQPPIMVYNAELLARHGLEPPSTDWTFDEFLELITSVTSISGSEKSYGFLLSSNSVNTSELLYAGNDLQWLDLSGDFPMVNLNTPEMVNTLSWLNDMEKSGVLFESSPEEDWWTAISSAVQSGQIGFWTTYAGSEHEQFFKQQKATFEIGIAPIPFTAEPNGPYEHAYQQGFYISHLSQNPEACWEFAKYLSEHSAVLNGIPARTSVSFSPTWESQVGVTQTAIYRVALANTLVENDPHRYNYLLIPVNNWLWRVYQNIKIGNDPMQELSLAQQKADVYLACLTPLDVSHLTDKDLSAEVEACAKQSDPSY